MHEFSMMMSIVELVKSEMEKRPVIKVTEINLEVGDLTFLSHDALQFGFQALVETEPRIGPDSLKIIPVPAEVKCSDCGFSGAMKFADSEANHLMTPVFQCPECAGPVEIVRGKECTVRNIRMELED
ncbi:MAG: hydrogenase maturation nickel metallochaperone HypA [Candidatus Thermoplasmatota archaeon]|nr:hydrogenase maturation nickel metallochaperone HypA [Candidatus Thermoplasmatota archaeon]MBU4071136.1 hydrogenase maturation nickel metallochaperone HypA [Candidatus Thermoplasmatota archaeon]MBU4143707.1 hydrogenase maturation nickel metallochaperone HypA [Candidatus Thermoplasmatota archaeon]MBU4591779.1 hydrogenase maturation nickel metallochaperone HypA [Candidatus Thermoplasmatota archaeon]